MTLSRPRPDLDRRPPQLCRHCEAPLLQVSVPDGPHPIRLHEQTLQSRCAPPLRTTAYPAPMSLVDGVWMTERMARVVRGLPAEPLAVPEMPGLPETPAFPETQRVPVPARDILLPLPRIDLARTRDPAASTG